MKIDKIIQEYNMNLCLRDSLPTCDAEIQELEEDENVQKYIRLTEHRKKYQHLRKQTDADILDDVIKNDNEVIDEDVYFCYGKNFIGHPRLAGGFYIEQHTRGSIRRLSGFVAAKYRNLAKPDEIIIMPRSETTAFEENHQTIQATTAVPEEEYYELRRHMYEEAIDRHINGTKKLIKEPQND